LHGCAQFLVASHEDLLRLPENDSLWITIHSSTRTVLQLPFATNYTLPGQVPRQNVSPISPLMALAPLLQLTTRRPSLVSSCIYAAEKNVTRWLISWWYKYSTSIGALLAYCSSGSSAQSELNFSQWRRRS
jgi:hypothetical protein